MPARFVNPQTVYKPPGYTQVVETSGTGHTVYLSGQVGLASDGKLAGGPGDFRAQTTQVFENLKQALSEVGASFDHVVKLNVYVTDSATQLAVYREVRDRYVNTAAPPASTLVQVSRLALEGLLIEVEAVAFVPSA